MTIEECKKLRNEIVSRELAKTVKPKRKPKRKRGERPPDAKMTPMPSKPEKAEEPPEPEEQ